MKFDSQNSPVLAAENTPLSSSTETIDYGLNPTADESSQLQSSSVAGENLELEPTQPIAANGDNTHQLVFIDSTVEDSQTLVDNISGAAEVVVLDSNKDELIQISEHLSNYENLDAVHIVSHGESGQLSFGNATLNSDTLPKYKQVLEDWSLALDEEADLLLYGCDVADGEGDSFVRELSQVTNADIAASVDDTGIDGDWELETNVGEIEATSIFEDEIASAYQHNLAPGDINLTPDQLPDFSSVDLSSTDFNFTSVPADDLTLFAEAGLDFNDVDASTLDNINFNEIPAEDLAILRDSGLKLEPLSSEEIAEINLDALSGLNYLPEGINVSSIRSLNGDTTFAQLSDKVVANANLFNYKNPDLEIESDLSIEQLSKLSQSDFKALDYAGENQSSDLFDSEFYLTEYPSVEKAGVNPYADYIENGGSRYPNQVFKSFGTADGTLVASADLTSSQFGEFQESASSVAEDNDEIAALPIILGPVIVEGIKLIAITAASLGTIKAANNIQEILAEGDIDVFRSPFPEPTGETGDNNTGSTLDEVDSGTEPFDLGAATKIDPEKFPSGNDFIEGILDGQFEFPDAEEGGVSFLAADIYDNSQGFTTDSNPDPAADRLAEKLGGKSRQIFNSDSEGREIDVVSEQYVAETKEGNPQLKPRLRKQAKALFEAAQQTEREVYYEFENPPREEFVKKLNEYSERYGVKLTIDVLNP